jgi:hypothetical protein
MTQEDIIRMAREAGIEFDLIDEDEGQICYITSEGLERFAALVRADEREACAKACKKVADDYYDCTGVANAITAAIRARGQA